MIATTHPHDTAQTARLAVQPLTSLSFAPYGDVIELSRDNARRPINDGSCVRHHDLARPSAAPPGLVGLSLFDAAAAPSPVNLREMERHVLGSQAFAPFGAALQMLLVVADARIAPAQLRPGHLRAFVSNGRQGVQFRAGTWHHPLVALQAGAWLVADRIAQAPDCDIVPIHAWKLCCVP